MGMGTIIPGYLKMRDLELNEANLYTLERSIRMKEEADRKSETLQRAGVEVIKSYVDSSQQDLISRYEKSEPDSRVSRYIIDTNGNTLLQSNGVFPLPVSKSLINLINHAQNNKVLYESGTDKWLVAVQKHDKWGWYTLASMSYKEVYRESKTYLYYILTVSGIVALMVLGLYVLLTRQLRRRVELIMEHLTLYRDGQYEKRIPSSVPDELSVLQRGINSMIDSIEMEILSRIAIEEELNTYRLEAEQANQSKTEFLENVSHEIRKQLNNIIGFSELLYKSKLGKKQASYAGNVLHASKNLSVLAKDILCLSNIEQGALKLTPEFFDLPAVMRETFDPFSQLGKQKDLKINLEIAHQIPTIVYADKSACTQVIGNLVHNAVNYTLDGGVNLVISLAEENDEQFVVNFRISNTGIGVKKDDRHWMSASGKQVSQKTKRDGHTGLELKIAKGILDSLGGSIHIKAKNKGGTSISVLIPFDKQPLEHYQGALDSEMVYDSIKGITALVVDDDTLGREYITEIFAGIDAKCIAVTSGKEALAYLEEEDIDIVLMDMRLPEKESEWTIKMIRQKLPAYLNDIPIIAMTANVYEKDIERYSALKVSAHIAKPFNSTALLDSVLNVLDEQ